MFQDENIKPEGEGMNPTDTEDTTTEDVEEEVEGEQVAEVDYKLELEREKKKTYELQQRLKKEKAKGQRSDLSTPDTPQENAIQEQVLKAQGMSEELINVLKTVSEEQGIDLITAQKDDYFLYRKEKMEQEARDKEAALGASKGSGGGKARKDFSTTNLSADEHREMWKKAMGR